MRKFTADFETTTDPNDCRVWAYAICEIGYPDNFTYGNSIDDFMEWCAGKENYLVLFHNLKFDGDFILNWLLKNGFEYVQDKKERKDRSFTTLITDMGAFYAIEVYFNIKGHHTNKVTFHDSLKLLNFSVDEIAKSFDLPIRKLELDYDAKRPVGHELTAHEVDYIRNDVEIMARALDILYKKDMTKMTVGGNALDSFKKMCNGFNKYFPALPLDVDADIRKSYKGGFTYLSPKYREKETGAGDRASNQPDEKDSPQLLHLHQCPQWRRTGQICCSVSGKRQRKARHGIQDYCQVQMGQTGGKIRRNR